MYFVRSENSVKTRDSSLNFFRFKSVLFEIAFYCANVCFESICKSETKQELRKGHFLKSLLVWSGFYREGKLIGNTALVICLSFTRAFYIFFLAQILWLKFQWQSVITISVKQNSKKWRLTMKKMTAKWQRLCLNVSCILCCKGGVEIQEIRRY